MATLARDNYFIFLGKTSVQRSKQIGRSAQRATIESKSENQETNEVVCGITNSFFGVGPVTTNPLCPCKTNQCFTSYNDKPI